MSGKCRAGKQVRGLGIGPVSAGRGEIHSLVEIGCLPEVPFNEVSNSANGLNSSLRYHQFLDIYEIKLLMRKLVETMAMRIGEEGDATDCSRLAWLSFRLGENAEAKRLVDQGLKMDPRNEYCTKLREKLSHEPISGVN